MEVIQTPPLKIHQNKKSKISLRPTSSHPSAKKNFFVQQQNFFELFDDKGNFTLGQAPTFPKLMFLFKNDIGQWVGGWVGGKIDGGHQVADTPPQLLDTHSLQV